MTDNNYIAYLAGFKQTPLLVKKVADDRYPDDDEIIVKNAAVAMNQVDWKQQEFPWTHFQYPLGLGEDVAGEVVDVGGSVTRFKIGDRVLGHSVCLVTGDERHAAFQNYTVLQENMASPIPASLPYERACVLPLGVSTASAALFQTDVLGLPSPSENPSKTGTTILIWGGSSAVGSNAIQLAVAAGVEVIATASKPNFEIVKKLGASDVVDYRSPTVVDDLKALLASRTLAGAFDSIGDKDLKKSYIPMASAIADANGKRILASTADWVDEKDQVKGVEFKPIQAVDIRNNEVGAKVYQDFLPGALASGKYIIFPEPKVAGKGLAAIQDALKASKGGSATKTVVLIE